MNRQLFMRDLNRFLADLPAEEREQALNYYEDYFEDAGIENEQKVIEELGSPVDVAKQIKSVNREHISYGEGSAAKAIAYPKIMDENTSQYNHYYNGENHCGNNSFTSQENKAKKSWTQDPGKVTLVVILAVLAIPVGLPLLSALFGVAVSIIACLFSLFIVLFVMGGALVFSGIAGIVCTVFAAIGGHYASSVLTLGFSLILISVGLILLWLGVLFCSKGIPAVWKLIIKCCRGIGKGIKNFFS